MGLLKIIRKLKETEKQLRILIIGLDNAGKTTIVKRFSNQDINTVSPTLGFQIQTLQYQGFQLNFWDIGGQSSLRAYWRNYYEETDGLIWVVDSADQLRLDICKEELHKLLSEEKLAGASLLVFANKQDIENSYSLEDIHKMLDIDNIQGRHTHLQPCSAVSENDEQLREGINWLIEDIADRIFMFD
eukprot:TRINITY_DN760_c0_g1_i1.p1 TRINITY_DN760_c0_g1~~TRINITY_DN760_c0_g1_i1.p1  ORF type:complete len:187 (-),score=35.03 TRINITY_DN760_c0_g1_i1:40-600(-)